MLRNWFLAAFRNLRKQALYSCVSVSSLALAYAACILVAAFLHHEWRYDEFVPHAERTYRVVRGSSCVTPVDLAVRLSQGSSEVEDAVRASPHLGSPILVAVGDHRSPESAVLSVDRDFLRFFGLPLAAGDAGIALAGPNNVVLSRAAAERFFGTADPMGQSLQMEEYGESRPYTVTGILTEPPGPTHLRFDFLVPLVPDGLPMGAYQPLVTYVRLAPRIPASAAETTINILVHDRYPEWRDDQAGTRFFLERVTDAHLSPVENLLGDRRNRTDLYLHASAAAMLLLIATLNHVNLATARAARRFREVAVRKVVGSTRGQLFAQFMGEAALVGLLALVLGGAAAELALPWFSGAMGEALELPFTAEGLWPTLALLGLLTSLLAGAYPAILQARGQVSAMLSARTPAGRSRSGLRVILLLAQFVISIGLTSIATVVFLQMRYLETKDLGFEAKGLIEIDAGKVSRALYSRYKLGDQVLHLEVIKDKLLADPRILSVTATGGAPGHDYSTRDYSHPDAPNEPAKYWRTLFIDRDYLRTMRLRLSQGTDLVEDFAARGSTEDVILNETAARELGAGLLVGLPLLDSGRMLPGRSRQYPLRVAGVVADFHYQSLHEPVEPLVLRLHPDPSVVSYLSHIIIRVDQRDLPSALAHVRSVLQEITPDAPFEYDLVQERFEAEKLYSRESRLLRVVGLLALLAVTVACIGVVGMSAHAAETRAREIAIRRVAGASVAAVLGLLSTGYVRVVLAAGVLVSPAVYWFSRNWLAAFAYHADPGPAAYLAVVGVILTIALGAAGTQALRAALADPVEALRQE